MVYLATDITVGQVFALAFIIISLAYNVESEVSGSGAEFTQFKFAVFIYEINEHFSCTGALISNRHVLTVARYFAKIPEKCSNCNFGYCVAGDIYRFYKPLKSTWYRQKRLIESVKIHPNYYDRPKPMNNLAILTTRYKFFFTKYVGPINLANYALKPRDACVAVGFLDKNYGSPWAPNIDLTWFSAKVTDDCNYSGIVCATTGRRSIPLGDYGELLIENSLPPLLHGLLTEFLRTRPGERPYGGAFFIVANYEEWIIDQISKKITRSGKDRLKTLNKLMVLLCVTMILILTLRLK